MHLAAVVAALAAALPTANVPSPRCQIIQEVRLDGVVDASGRYIPTTEIISTTKKCRPDKVRRLSLRSRP